MCLRYFMALLGVFVSFVNLIICSAGDRPLSDFFLYFGVVFLGSIFLVIIRSNYYLAFISALFGVVTIFQSSPDSPSWGIFLILVAQKVTDNRVFSIFMFSIVFGIVIGQQIFRNVLPHNVINILAIYLGIYIIDFLAYNIKRPSQRKTETFFWMRKQEYL